MKLQVLSVHDSKADAFLPPFFIPTLAMARRIFEDTVNDQNHMFAKHPEDYTLFHLGEFDDTNCQFDLKLTPESLGLAVTFIAQE